MQRKSTSNKKVVRHPSGENLSRKKRKKFKMNKSKLPLFLVIALMAYVVFSFGLRFDNLYALQQDIHELQVKVDKLEERNSELKDKLEKVNSDSYVEKVAREELGLIKAGETKVVPVESLPRAGSANDSEQDT